MRSTGSIANKRKPVSKIEQVRAQSIKRRALVAAGNDGSLTEFAA